MQQNCCLRLALIVLLPPAVLAIKVIKRQQKSQMTLCALKCHQASFIAADGYEGRGTAGEAGYESRYAEKYGSLSGYGGYETGYGGSLETAQGAQGGSSAFGGGMEYGAEYGQVHSLLPLSTCLTGGCKDECDRVRTIIVLVG